MDPLEFSANTPPAVKFVNVMLLDSIRLGASQIHLERRDDVGAITYSINNDPQAVLLVRLDVYEQAVGRLRLMADLTLTDPRAHQSGRFNIDVRESTQPGCECVFEVTCAPGGESVVLHRIRTSGELPATFKAMRSLTDLTKEGRGGGSGRN